MAQIAAVMQFMERVPALQRALKRVQSGQAAASPQEIANMARKVQDLQADILVQRMLTFGEAVKGVPEELASVRDKIANPLKLTVRQVAEGAVVAVQIFGFFCIGEMVGRRHVIGYTTPEQPSSAASHH
ncbi:unnamed protein product (mitochondrion) [Plasmodiophora brassicae]|uniref:Uncharacterized protein n=1 Tax=Plasmodiophora brassicae TaxID=37360 RepID=A0A0G4J4X6_PLABS|nr:hypothetical protein PBRA_002610 [Plasmodiophora brassicae]SPQ94773.1 unnamed protein product [Plasmodiophora brassicae]